MKFSLSDLPMMRWSMLAICASTLFSGILLYGSGEYAGQKLKDKNSAQAQLNNARNQLTAAREDRKNMAAYADEYAALAEGGIIGDGTRMDWLEGLENLRRQQLVADFRYTIAPQKAYTPVQPINSEMFDIQYSEMKLEFELLHEGQLLNFFSALRSQINGHYQLEGCTLQRPAANSGLATGLKAVCRGGWITLKNRNATP
ncbi:MAG TPA: hypothetical protein VFW59_03570 [Gallionella sp.]|nr:hypothetical protein [Gallionella sp.]